MMYHDKMIVNSMRYIRMTDIQTIKNMTIKNIKNTRHYSDLENIKNREDFIKYWVSPSCVSCIHFLSYYPNENIGAGRCKLFGEKDLVTGRIHYEYASVCRENYDMCMPDGIYYKKNPDDKLNYKIERE